MDTIVYKAVFGPYDRLGELPFVPSAGTRYICFTDDPKLRLKTWDVRVVDREGSAAHMNRRIKMFPQTYLPACESSIYLDGHVHPKRCLAPLASRYLQSSEWASPRHREGGNVLVELVRCYDTGKITLNELKAAMRILAVEPVDEAVPFPENGLIIRLHASAENQKFAEAWWDLYNKGPQRDQLHWQRAYRLARLKFQYMDEAFDDGNEWFELRLHRGMALRQCGRIVRRFLRNL